MSEGRDRGAPGRQPLTPRQLVATLGPASFSLVEAIVEAGATALRLNSSHLQADLSVVVQSVRERTETPIVIDLQGAKMRLGWFSDRSASAGEVIRFALEDRCANGETAVPVPHPELFRVVRAGETLAVDDGRVHLRVDSVSDEHIDATCLKSAMLRARKGINRLVHPVEPVDLCARDVEAIAVTKEVPNVAYALSFVRSGFEIAWVRRRAPASDVIAKAERREAIDSLSELAAEADAIWVCRGDLGVQLGLCDLARTVAGIRPSIFGCPVLMAGQVFEHLTQHSEPTRSEVCHLADLLDRGYAGIVLSDETAIGVDPVGAVRATAELVREL